VHSSVALRVEADIDRRRLTSQTPADATTFDLTTNGLGSSIAILRAAWADSTMDARCRPDQRRRTASPVPRQ